MTMDIYIEIVKSVTQPFLSVCIVAKIQRRSRHGRQSTKKAMAQEIIRKDIQKEERSNVTIIYTKLATNFTDIFQKIGKIQSYIIRDCFYDNKNMKQLQTAVTILLLSKSTFKKGSKLVKYSVQERLQS